MITPEGKVKASVKKFLDHWGIWYFLPVSNGMGTMGIPDFICCWGGRFLGIETKAPGKRSNTTPGQKRILELIQKHGGMSIVVDDVRQLEEFLHERHTG
jgi:hypothetical protein